MFHFLYQAAAANLISAFLIGSSTLLPDSGTATKPLTFGASAYVNQYNKIRLAVQKDAPVPVLVRLSDQQKNVLYQTTIGKKQMKVSMQLDVSELEDGTYTVEVSSAEGRIVKNVTIGTPQTTRTIVML